MTIITLLLALFFTLAGSIKLFGWQKFVFETQLGFFKKYGLNRLIMFMVGVVEFSAASLLLASLIVSTPLLNIVGAAGIAGTSMGAMFFHARFDTVKDAIPSIITFALSAFLLYKNVAVIIALF